MPISPEFILITEISSIFLGTFVLWISAKVFGSRLSFFLSFVITLIGTLFSKLSPAILPSLSIALTLIIGFVLRIVLIAAFGHVGIFRALLISLFPTIALVLMVLFIVGAS